MEHDLFRKPVSTPDQVRGRLFRDHALRCPDPSRSLTRSAGAFKPPTASSDTPGRNRFDRPDFSGSVCGAAGNLAADLSEVLLLAALSLASVQLLNWRSF
jgi:hypothetical protein